MQRKARVNRLFFRHALGTIEVIKAVGFSGGTIWTKDTIS